jgi:hypothetical protein
MSRTPSRVTQADIARALRAAKQAGAAGVEIRPDGTIEIKLHRDGVQHQDKAPYRAGLANWDDVLADKRTASPAETKPRRFGDRLRAQQPSGTDPLSQAFDRWTRGEITLDQLPVGKYPNGMRVYADGEWESIVRASPLQKRERDAIEAYFKAKGTIGYVKGGGLLTTERLAARGFVEVVQTREDGRVPYYGITPDGEAAWLAISGGTEAKE